jgi:hypothetical protein
MAFGRQEQFHSPTSLTASPCNHITVSSQLLPSERFERGLLQKILYSFRFAVSCQRVGGKWRVFIPNSAPRAPLTRFLTARFEYCQHSH